MTLDVPTLTLAGSFVALLSGGMLVFAWFQYREMSPVLWWAASDFVLAAAIALLAFGGASSSELLFGIAFVALSASPALLWSSTRLFNGLKPLYGWMLLGPCVVLAVNLLPVSVMADVRGGVGSFFNAAYLVAAAWTLIVQSREKLLSRWPLASFILVHAAMLMTGAVAGATSSYPVDALPPVNSIFGMIHFEALIFLVGTTIFVVAAMRESSELRHKQAAATDPLTGLANRREFLDKAERLLERSRRDDAALAVIALDLDRFKAVNDTFGHAMGDRVLTVFADVARNVLRPNDVIGRIGGEEFAAILPGSGAEAARAMAERIRRAFAAAASHIDGHTIGATLSAGVAIVEQSNLTLTELLQRADAALYSAKRLGRNRVELSEVGRPEKDPSRIIRVA